MKLPLILLAMLLTQSVSAETTNALWKIGPDDWQRVNAILEANTALMDNTKKSTDNLLEFVENIPVIVVTNWAFTNCPVVITNVVTNCARRRCEDGCFDQHGHYTLPVIYATNNFPNWPGPFAPYVTSSIVTNFVGGEGP